MPTLIPTLLVAIPGQVADPAGQPNPRSGWRSSPSATAA